MIEHLVEARYSVWSQVLKPASTAYVHTFVCRGLCLRDTCREQVARALQSLEKQAWQSKRKAEHDTGKLPSAFPLEEDETERHMITVAGVSCVMRLM